MRSSASTSNTAALNLRSSPNSLLALGLLACLGLAVGGCGGASSTSTASTTAAAPSSASPTTTTDNSIQTYGSKAAGSEKAALGAAALSFFRALAGPDYAKVCAGLAASNRQQLGALLKAKHRQGGCAAVLKTVIPPSAAAEARKAANATVTGVRVKGDTAFVLFRPSGGPASYFVMKREKGEWKAIGLAPGTPLNPAASLGG